MSTHTPEYWLVNRILDEMVECDAIYADGDETCIAPKAIRALARPIEDANKQIAELRAEVERLRGLV